MAAPSAPAPPLTVTPEGASSTARLLADLEARSRTEVDGVLAGAREEATRLRAEAEAQCAAIRDTALAACESELASAQAAARADARQCARRAILEAQHAAVARILSQVPRVASALGASCAATEALVAERIADVLGYLAGEPAELRCAPAVEALVRATVSAAAGVSVVADAGIVAGVRAATSDGRVVVDDTLDAWLARERPALAIRICAQLEKSDA